MMIQKDGTLGRRDILRLGIALPLSLSAVSCGMQGSRKVGNPAPETKVNKKSYWARRQEWKGEDWVFGVAQVGDRVMMVKHNNELGWAFPGGIVDPFSHGEKEKSNNDLIQAATEHTHDQTMIPVLAAEATVLAYGYVIDEYRKKVNMYHWVNVYIMSEFPPTPQANLREVSEARWIAVDDPELGSILSQRLEEISTAGEGKTLNLKRFP